MPEYHMRRTDREITDPAEKLNILKNGKFVTLALCRGDEPYVVTMNYGYDIAHDCLYFHCARQGLKLDFLRRNRDVCATVIDDLGYVDGRCDHKYRSVVMRGRMVIVDDIEEKKHGMAVLLSHLEGHPDEIRKKTLSKEDVFAKVAILRMEILQISGKDHH